MSTNLTNTIIGILGGTFDPIHNGHLKIAEYLLEKLNLAEIRFLPNKIPPHRNQPCAKLEDRINMIKLAIEKNPKFRLDLTEAKRPGPSYMIDTLKIVHAENPDAILALIIGADVFSKFHTWHQSAEILDYAHLIIVNRERSKTEELKENALFKPQLISEAKKLSQQSAGFIYRCEFKPIATSATQIRHHLAAGQTTADLPTAVAQYIATHKIY